MKEKNKLNFHRLFWLVIFLLSIIVPLIINSSQPKLEMLDIQVTINESFSSLYEDRTYIDIYATFNREVHSGYVYINYYDSSDNLIKCQKTYLYSGETKRAESYIEYVEGDVSSYELVSYDFNPIEWIDDKLSIIIPFTISAFIFFFCSLLLSYKEYEYNGKIISVYSGWYHHTLRINGILCDEHNTFINHVPIYLSTNLDDETVIDVTITLTNRISIKINNRLL